MAAITSTARHSGLCLTVAAASVSDNAPIVQSACVAGAANQQWTAQLSPAGNAWAFVARHSNKCLGVTDGAVAEQVALVQVPCSGVASRLFIRREPGVNLTALDPNPMQQWGVVGSGLTVTNPKPYVWDFAEIGDRIYVAGTFTGVQRYGFDPNSAVIPQAYLAAFDRNTGVYIPGFAPVIDRTVYTLEVTPSGKLLVGGEFETVNGTARKGSGHAGPGHRCDRRWLHDLGLCWGPRHRPQVGDRSQRCLRGWRVQQHRAQWRRPASCGTPCACAPTAALSTPPGSPAMPAASGTLPWTPAAPGSTQWASLPRSTPTRTPTGSPRYPRPPARPSPVYPSCSSTRPARSTLWRSPSPATASGLPAPSTCSRCSTR